MLTSLRRFNQTRTEPEQRRYSYSDVSLGWIVNVVEKELIAYPIVATFLGVTTYWISSQILSMSLLLALEDCGVGLPIIRWYHRESSSHVIMTTLPLPTTSCVYKPRSFFFHCHWWVPLLLDHTLHCIYNVLLEQIRQSKFHSHSRVAPSHSIAPNKSATETLLSFLPPAGHNFNDLSSIHDMTPYHHLHQTQTASEGGFPLPLAEAAERRWRHLCLPTYLSGAWMGYGIASRCRG